MTYEDGVRIASRVVAIFLICWAINEAIEIPRELFSFVTAYRMAAETYGTAFPKATQNFYVNGSAQFVLQSLLRVSLSLAAAFFFYRCGSRIRSFFGPSDETADREAHLS